jgi:hypothetical protein
VKNYAMEAYPDTFDRWMVKQTEENDALFLNQLNELSSEESANNEALAWE